MHWYALKITATYDKITFNDVLDTEPTHVFVGQFNVYRCKKLR